MRRTIREKEEHIAELEEGKQAAEQEGLLDYQGLIEQAVRIQKRGSISEDKNVVLQLIDLCSRQYEFVLEVENQVAELDRKLGGVMAAVEHYKENNFYTEQIECLYS